MKSQKWKKFLSLFQKRLQSSAFLQSQKWLKFAPVFQNEKSKMEKIFVTFSKTVA
jgi:hypothetical protein